MDSNNLSGVLPYLPAGRRIIYINSDNRFLKEAGKMLVQSGCVKQPTAAVIVKNGVILGRGTNAGKKVSVCPREERVCRTGEGYWLCKAVCRQKGHAEVSAILDAREKGSDIRGASLYLEGHWWVCRDCWDEIIKAGISRVFLRKDSAALYGR
ncbi:MAG: deaminase [Candidatus Paceibacterota bacterium]|jgi:deoxycytidylate deaminase